MIEPAVGASTWASGSQVWNGTIGSLIANASPKARKTQNWKSAEKRPRDASSSGSESVREPSSPEASQTATMATSMSSEPARVKITNFSVE